MTLVLKNLNKKAEGFAKLNDASESILTADDPIIITDPPYFDKLRMQMFQITFTFGIKGF